ncbi:MAG: hypothetical protein AAGD22_00405 [Verrucomicrobiota bacterium]
MAIELPLDGNGPDKTLSLSQEAEHLARQSTHMKEQIEKLETLIVSTPFNRALHRIKTIDIVPADIEDDFISAPVDRLSRSRRVRLRELQIRNVAAFVALVVGLIFLAVWLSRFLSG